MLKEKYDLVKSLSWLFDLSNFLRLISIAVVKSKPTYCVVLLFPLASIENKRIFSVFVFVSKTTLSVCEGNVSTSGVGLCYHNSFLLKQ